MSRNTSQDISPFSLDKKITIGHYSIYDNENMLINTVNDYYDYIVDILCTTRLEFDKQPELNDYSFKRKVIQRIKLEIFPRYSDFQHIFEKGEYFPNDNLSELNYWPSNDEEKKHMANGNKPTMDLYTRFVKGGNTPSKLQALMNEKVPLSINMKHMNCHGFIVSKTNTGKSTLLLELAKNIMDKQEGSLVLIEPHGDISYDLARLCKNPDDLIYLDPFMNSEYSVTINIFDIENITQDNISTQSSLIVSTFRQILGTEFSISMQSLLIPVISVLLQIPNTSFYDMLKFLNDKENQELLEYGKTKALIPAHRLFFKTMFSESRFSISKFSISSKLNVLLQDSVFSNLLTGRSTIGLTKILNTPGKVLIIRLNGSKMLETLDSVGRFIISLIMSVAFQRNDIPIENRISTHLIIDEASLFLGEGIGVILEQARKFRLYLWMALQQNSQLPKSIESSILSNTAIKVVGINSHRNHTIMHKEINVSMDDLFSLKKKGEFYIKIGSTMAMKFRVSDRLFNEDLYYSPPEFKKIQREQIKKYYRKIDLSNIKYADIPNTHIETLKPYSKDTTEELLLDLKKDNNELLDY